MQNIDFSKKVKKTTPSAASTGENKFPSDLKRKNRFYILGLSLIIIAFTAGLATGIQLSNMRGLEENLVKYPDEQNPQLRNGSADTGTTLANPPKESIGGYLVKVGVYSIKQAEQITKDINNIPELAQIKPKRCKNVEENIPNRYLAFRSPASENRQSVFVGCFDHVEQARKALQAVLSSQLDGSSRSILYQID